jgi:phosphatidylglycerol:prolipoprotein diacylglycerol transferase
MGLQQFGYTFYYHPTFLYESVWNVIGFIIANIIYKHKRFHGQIALFYFAWYGFGRMFIEGFRTDSLYVPGTGIRISQLVGFICVIAAGAALITLTVLTRKRAPLLVLEDAAYEAAKKVEAELDAADKKATDKDTSDKEEAKESAEEPAPTEETVEESAEEPAEQEEKDDGNEN